MQTNARGGKFQGTSVSPSNQHMSTTSGQVRTGPKVGKGTANKEKKSPANDQVMTCETQPTYPSMVANPSKGGYVRTPHQIEKVLVEDERNSVVHGCAHACLFPRMRVTGIWVSKQVEAVGRTFPLLPKFAVPLR